MAAEDLIQKVREVLSQCRGHGIQVDGAVLFGSFARGDERAWSDIDLMLLINDAVPNDRYIEVGIEASLVASKVDIRFEVIPVYQSRFETDDTSPIIDIARTEGIRIAA